MKKLLPRLVIAIIFLSYCKKTSDNTDKQPPVVTLASPTNQQVIPAGNVTIKATIADNDTLQSLHLNIEGPDFIHYAYAGSGKTQNLDENIPVPIKGKYILTLEAHDKSGNIGEAKIEITIN